MTATADTDHTKRVVLATVRGLTTPDTPTSIARKARGARVTTRQAVAALVALRDEELVDEFDEDGLTVYWLADRPIPAHSGGNQPTPNHWG